MYTTDKTSYVGAVCTKSLGGWEKDGGGRGGAKGVTSAENQWHQFKGVTDVQKKFHTDLTSMRFF